MHVARSQDHAKYVVDGGRIGNVGRYINHSCNVRSPIPLHTLHACLRLV